MNDPRPPAGLDQELRIAFYSAARDELIERIRLRDQALFGYVVLLGGYFGFALSLGDPAGTGLGDWREIVSLFALPGASIIFTLIVVQHHVQISQLARYIRVELMPDLENRHWDSWCANNSPPIRISSRRWAQTLVLSMPSAYVLIRLAMAWDGRWNWLVALLALFAGGAIFYILRWNGAVERLRVQDRTRIPQEPAASPASGSNEPVIPPQGE